jgi:protein import protein ZIM17
MSKTAYTKGVVIIKCDGCKSLHLMADHLGWFDTTKKAQGTIEEIMAAKGETVTRVKFNPSDIQTNGSGDKAAIDELFESATPEVMKEIEDGLLEWLPKNEEALLSAPESLNTSSSSA